MRARTARCGSSAGPTPRPRWWCKIATWVHERGEKPLPNETLSAEARFPDDFRALLDAGYGPLSAGLESIKVRPLVEVLQECETYYRPLIDFGFVLLTTDFGGNAVAWDIQQHRVVRIDHVAVGGLERGDDGWLDEDGELYDLRTDADEDSITELAPSFHALLERELAD